MILLASAVDGVGGIPIVNQLALAAAREAAIAGSVVALVDRPEAAWIADWPGSIGAAGSWPRFAAGAFARRADARDSVIFATHVGLTPVGRMLKAAGRTRLITFIHGVESWRPLPARTRWGIRGCDLIVANSRYTLRRFFDCHPQFSKIPGSFCYLPARPLDAPTTGIERATDRLRVLVVGRLWGRGMKKGQRELIQVWPQVLADFPAAELCVVGDGAGQAELLQVARAHGVEKAVTFSGLVSDDELNRLYATASVFAMPSRGEGFGLVFAEAMAHGLPCIASRLDAGAEVVIDGETGFVVDPARPEEIIRALRTLLTDSKLRTRMGEAGRKRAADIFSLSQFNRRIQQLLAGSAVTVDTAATCTMAHRE